MSPIAHVELLGRMRLTSDAIQLDRFGPRKAGLLLAYLALRPGMHSRVDLGTLLWPNSEAGRKNLRNTLSLLKDSLAAAPGVWETLARDGAQGLGFRSDAVTTDVAYFLAGLDRARSVEDPSARAARLREALSHYGGIFAPGEIDEAAGGIDEWVALERARLAALRDEALLALSRLAEAGGDRAQALAYALEAAQSGTCIEAHDLVARLGRPQEPQATPALQASRERPDVSGLDDTGMRCLAVLGLTPGGGTAELVEYVAGVRGARAALDALVERGLASCSGEDRLRRYRAAPSAAAKPAAMLKSRERRSLLLRLARYELRWWVTLQESMRDRARPVPQEVLAEAPNVSATVEALLPYPEAARTGAELARLLYPLNVEGAAVCDHLRLVEKALDAWPHMPKPARWLLHFGAGHMAQDCGDMHAAERHLRDALAIAERHDPPDARMSVCLLELLGLTCHHLERDGEAVVLYERALQRACPAVGADTRARVLCHYADALLVQGRPTDAERALDEALGLLKGRAHEGLRSVALCQLGAAATYGGDLRFAARCFDESLGIRRALRDRPGERECLRGLAELRAREGMTVEARMLATAALSEDPAPLNPHCAAAAQGLIGWIDFLDGRLEDADRALSAALAIWRSAGHRRWQGALTARRAAVALVAGRRREARAMALEALGLCPGSHALLVRASATCTLARVACAEQRWRSAARCSMESLALRRAAGHQPSQPESLEVLALASLGLGLSEDARNHTDEAARVRLAMGTPLPAVWETWQGTVMRTLGPLPEGGADRPGASHLRGGSLSAPCSASPCRGAP